MIMKFYVKGVELFSNFVRVNLGRKGTAGLDVTKLNQAIDQWKQTMDQKGGQIPIPVRIEKIEERSDEQLEKNLQGTLHSYLKQVQEMFTRNIASEFADSILLLTPEEYRTANINVGSIVSIDMNILDEK